MLFVYVHAIDTSIFFVDKIVLYKHDRPNQTLTCLNLCFLLSCLPNRIKETHFSLHGIRRNSSSLSQLISQVTSGSHAQAHGAGLPQHSSRLRVSFSFFIVLRKRLGAGVTFSTPQAQPASLRRASSILRKACSNMGGENQGCGAAKPKEHRFTVRFFPCSGQFQSIPELVGRMKAERNWIIMSQGILKLPIGHLRGEHGAKNSMTASDLWFGTEQRCFLPEKPDFYHLSQDLSDRDCSQREKK